MATRVASRELRNNTAAVLRRAAAGEEIDITVNGEAVARIAAIPDERPQFIPKAELLAILDRLKPDPELAELLKTMDQPLDELGPVW